MKFEGFPLRPDQFPSHGEDAVEEGMPPNEVTEEPF
jgi:hypothetical protein